MPIIKKFFSNKIESSTNDWGDYLLEIADTFARFDGEIYNRELLTEQFQNLSGRSPYALRDASNFRDEFGAYGGYLGVFRIDKINGEDRLFLSNAAKKFLCTPEPDVEAFCRLQLSLFQYPNGLGYVPTQNRCQANIINDTYNEVINNIRLNPLRLICRSVYSLYHIDKIAIDKITIPYKLIFFMFNNNRINNNFSPEYEDILEVIHQFKNSVNLPSWLNNKQLLTNFKRNFHIFERIGIFKRYDDGILIDDYDYERIINYVNIISEIKMNFIDLNDCLNLNNVKEEIKSVILNYKWGRYYDSLNLPVCIISDLANEIEVEYSGIVEEDIVKDGYEFPELKSYSHTEPKTFCHNKVNSDPFRTLILREKANREHTRILSMLAALLRTNGHEPYENIFIDLLVNNDKYKIIFEIKSNNKNNTISQVRKAVSQLYEYRYKSNIRDACLCLILQQEPNYSWIKDYLVNDRNIMIGWLVDDVRLECPPECYKLLHDIGLLT